MSTPEAGGSYVRGADGALTRLERTLGPNETPEIEAAEAAPAKAKPRNAPAATAAETAEES